MFDILTLNKISKNGLKHLPTDQFNIVDQCDAPDGIILRSFSMHEMELPKSLKGIARAGAGVNNVPVDKCTDLGIVVFNSPGANANAVKELVIAGLLMSSRRVVEGINWIQAQAGQEDIPAVVEKGKAEYVGPEITGKTLGVVGLGAIGWKIATAATALGMNVVGYDVIPKEHPEWKIVNNLDELYAEADYITLHLAFNKETKNMINAETIAKMKDGVKILNFARGELVDDDAILSALGTKVSRYVTDFPNGKLLGNRDIITVPHLGASTPESEENCAEMAAIEIREFLKYGNVKNSVNFPNCELEYTGKPRVCVAFKGEVADAVKAGIEAAGATVVASECKLRGAVGYALFDLDKTVDGAALEGIEGVTGVRVL